MKALTKRALAEQLRRSPKQPGLTQGECLDIIETLADLVVCYFVENGRAVTVRGFGTFKLSYRKGFTSVHPQTGAVVFIPNRKTITFKPSAEVRRRINS